MMSPQTLTITLAKPANDMVQEEILKQIPHLSPRLARPRFASDGLTVEVDLVGEPADQGKVSTSEDLSAHIEDLRSRIAAVCAKVQRGLRSLERKIVYTAQAEAQLGQPDFFRGAAHLDQPPGVHFTGLGQAILEGAPLRLFEAIDRRIVTLGRAYRAEPMRISTLIPPDTLAKCDYFRSFPHTVTFASHLLEDADRIDAFRNRHAEINHLDDHAAADLDQPKACLSPAACYHVYKVYQGRSIPAEGVVRSVCGKCFRYESAGLGGLRRLWDFTMREVVFLGTADHVLKLREQAIVQVGEILEEFGLAGLIRTASDPFFIAPDSVGKTYFQLSSATKYEVALPLPDGSRLAVGSLNYHTDFFGRAFDVTNAGGGFMHSVCIAFGLERFVHAFLARHGCDPDGWPRAVRDHLGDGQGVC